MLGNLSKIPLIHPNLVRQVHSTAVLILGYWPTSVFASLDFSVQQVGCKRKRMCVPLSEDVPALLRIAHFPPCALCDVFLFMK